MRFFTTSSKCKEVHETSMKAAPLAHVKICTCTILLHPFAFWVTGSDADFA